VTHAQLHELATLSAPESTMVLFLGYTGSDGARWRRSVPFPTFLTQPLENAMVGKNAGELVFAAPSRLPLRSSNWKRSVFDRAMGEMLAIPPT